MTTFTGPVIIRALDSDTTSAAIDAQGNATFASLSISSATTAQDVTFTGTLNFSGVSVTALSTAQSVAFKGQDDGSAVLVITVNGSSYGIPIYQLGTLG